MSELSHYIKLRGSLSGCNAKQFECDKYLDCDSCLEDKIKEHDAKVRADVIEKIKESIKFRLIGELGLEGVRKYGNKNAKQQANSYATVMKYEIADCVDDLLDDLEQMKEQNK